MYKVFQIILTDHERDIVNSGERLPKYEAKIEASFERFSLDDLHYYSHVANVFTDDPEEAFRLMNLWDEPSRVSKLDPGCLSLSVGDILEDDSGARHIVEGFGFRRLPDRRK